MRNIPNVALYNWVRAGSRNEAPGITGLAHFFEHMMFNGTARRVAGDFDRLMEAQGGANNAFTSDDVTVYQDWFPRDALELIFDLEADRIAHLAFDPEVIESERGVVASERRLSVDDNNHGHLAEQVQAAAFVAHPYQFPTIGWPADIQSWTLADLQKFFRTYYAPNNQTFVFAGDVSPEEVFALARKYLEPIPRQAAPEPVRAREPEQTAERRVARPAQCANAAAPVRLQSTRGCGCARACAEPADLHPRRWRRVAPVSRARREPQGHRRSWRPLARRVRSRRCSGCISRCRKAPIRMPCRPSSMQSSHVSREMASPPKSCGARRAWPPVAFWKKLSTIDGKAQLLGEYEIFHGDWAKLFLGAG